MSTTSQTLIDRYNIFISKTRPWDFFTGLGDYLQYVLDTPLLKAEVDRQIAKRDAEYEEVAKLEERTAREMRRAWQKLMAVVERGKLDVSTFTAFTSAIPTPPGAKTETIPEQWQAFESGRVSMSGFHSDHLGRFVFDIAANLLKLGYRKDLEDYLVSVRDAQRYFGTIDDTDDGLAYGGNTHGNFIFSDTWPKRFQKERLVEIARGLRPWGAFDHLMKFWQARQQFIVGAGFYDAMLNVTMAKDYRFGGSDALDVARGMKDLELLNKEHGTNDQALQFLHVEDFRTRTATIAGALLSSLPENKSAQTRHDSSVRHAAIEQLKDKYWRQEIEKHMRRVNAFIEQYEIDRESREAEEAADEKWWADGATPSFNDKTGKIILDGKECQISLAAINRQVVCSMLFSRPLGDWVLEVDVINDFQRGDHSPTALKDTVRSINTEIRRDFKIRRMLEYHRARRVRVRKEIFS